MANDGSVDVLIQKQAIENVAIANKALELTLKNILAINEASRKGAAKPSSSPQSAENINKANQAAIKRLELANQTLVMRKKLIQSEKALGNAMTAENAKIIQNRTEIARRNKIVKDATKINSALTGAYEKLSIKLNQLRKRYKDVAVTEGTASKNAIKLRKELEKLDTRLKKVDASAGQFQRNVGNYPRQMKAAIRGLRALASALGVVGGLFLAMRITRDTFERLRQFDKVMRNLAGILGTTRKELVDLEKEIVKVAGSSIKTSNEVAELAQTLITLGKTKSEVIDLLDPVNQLSIGLEATSQEAGELLIQTLNAFGEGSNEAQRFADIIAKMRTSTALDFERIKDALGFLAPVAKTAGLSFEEASAMLGVLVDNGIKASRAGRLLSTSLIKLATDGKTLEQGLDELNKAQSQNKTEIELLEISYQLFGKQSAAIGLILADNRDKTAELTKEFENADGTLKQLTDQQLTSLDARLKILDSTWEKFILNIDSGTGALSNFLKGTIDVTAAVITMIDEVGTASDGFLSFFSNLALVSTPGGLGQIMGSNLANKATKERISLLNELSDLRVKQAKETGVILTKSQIEAELQHTNNVELKKMIESYKELNKVIPGGDGEGGDTTKKTIDFYKKIISETKALINSTATSKDEYDKFTATILEAENALFLLELRMKGVSRAQGFTGLSAGVPTTGSAITGGTSPTLADSPVDTNNPISALQVVSSEEFELARQSFDQLSELGLTLLDRKLAAIDAEIQAEEDKYAVLFALAEGDSEQQRLLAIQREEDLQKLEKKRREEEKKQAIFNKAQALINIAINTAVAVTKVGAETGLLGIALAPLIIALGAAQAATVLATPIPQFAEGGTMGHDGVALVGDGGRKEVIKNPDGSIQVTPSTDTLVNLKKGAEIFPSIDAFNQDGNFDISDKIYSATVMASLSINNDKITSYLETQKVFNDNLLNAMLKNTEAIKKQKLKVNSSNSRIDIADELYKMRY
jgi:hypothetical protein